MPIVPIYKTEETKSLVLPEANTAKRQETDQPSDFSARMELARSVREETEQKGSVSVSFLDRFAVTHFDTQDKENSALQDYVALRRVAQKEAASAAQQAQHEQLRQEVAWVKQVGALSADGPSLDAYLKLQIPALLERMKQAGLSAGQVQHTVEGLRTDTIQNNILRSLSVGDWQAAQQVFHAQKDFLPLNMQNHFSEKIRHAFARFEARQLWQQAKSHTQQTGVSTEEAALSLVQEPDEDLRADVQREIAYLNQEDARQTAAQQAEVFARLSQADGENSHQLLDVQTVLNGEEVERARRAAAQIQEPATEHQQRWFVQHYFERGAVSPDRAFDKGLCTARDYFSLKAADLREQSGEALSQDKWLCRGLQTWMKHQGFDEEDITRATYAVLTGAPDTSGRAAVWKQIKTLLTY